MAQTLMITGFLKASSLHNPGNAGSTERKLHPTWGLQKTLLLNF